MTCPCDVLIHPRPLAITAGRADLPRQIAGFPEFRSALLAALRGHQALAGWRARRAGDLGVMLLEMWAVVCDTVSFYDQVHAQEVYLRTARLERSVRGLVEILGYLPRPAVAAAAELALFLEGNRPVALPAGTAFRSRAFADQAPQLFELVRNALVHPWNDRWTLERPRPARIGEPGAPGVAPTELLLARRGAAVRAGDVLLVVASTSRARRISTVEAAVAIDGDNCVRAVFSPALALDAGTRLAEIRLTRATREARLWTTPTAAGSTAPISEGLTELVLDGLHRTVRAGHPVVLERGAELRCFAVAFADEVQQKVAAGTDAAGNTLYAWLPATRIALDAQLNAAGRAESATTWSTGDAALLTVHHGFEAAGTVAAPATATLADDDPLIVAAPVREPDEVDAPRRFALTDADDRAALVSGALDPDTRVLTRDGGDAGWDPPLSAPVEVWGNLVTAMRGETVAREVLGSGDASIPYQRFTLKKSPVTYLTASDGPGVVSTLQVRVGGVRWTEVPSFYGTGPDDEIYVVRVAADGVATVLFGDGVNGARLPTGTRNVIARYRFGAGGTLPPAGSITQVARPVPGLSAVAQPVAARGGADAEPADQVRTLAPRSALVLGRAVSLLDMNALAAAVPGVRATQTSWGWHEREQRPVVQCWYAGAPEPGAVAGRLRAMSAPTTPIAADPAQALLSLLMLQVATDPRRVASEVIEEVFDLLAARRGGLLRPEQLGIGQPLYRSELSAAVLSVPGAVAIHFSAMLWLDRAGAYRWWAHDGYGASPGVGAYFDFESGGLWLNGEVRRLG